MLQVYFLQQWYGLADETLEDAIYDSQAMRLVVGIDLSQEGVPDATTLLKFRHLFERHNLTRGIFEEITTMLSEQKCLMKEGTIVDATIIAVPSSRKNQSRQRDPEMHQTRRGISGIWGWRLTSQWMLKVAWCRRLSEPPQCPRHQSGPRALRGQEKDVFADAGYLVVQKLPEIISPLCQPPNGTSQPNAAGYERCPKAS